MRTGHLGNDILLGGAGADTYVYNTGDGFDTIIDSDGQGSIVVDGNTLAGGEQYGDERVHRDAAGHLYVQAGNNLIVDNAMIVLNYSNGNLGLNMSGPVEAANLVTTRDIYGDFATVDYDPNTLGVQVQVDDLSNVITDRNTPAPDRVDLLMDSAGNDHILGGGGDDIITAYRGGDDLIEGGAGNDSIRADGGDDVVMGGTGSDVLSGGVGNDRLYADIQISVADAIANGNTDTATGLKADWLAGGAGDDILIGSAGNDVLSGGGGQDLLVGGAGDDYLLGDADYLPAPVTNGVYFAETGWWAYPYSPDWTVTPEANGNYTFTTAAESVLNPADSAADVIYAGDGNDVAWGGGGNDVIFGEAGDDILIGDAGNDILAGGTGNDTLYGGDGQDIYLYNRGDGVDTIYDDKADRNILRFGAGINSNNIRLHLGSLMLDLGNGDMIHINNTGQTNANGFDPNDVFNSSSISSFEFASSAGSGQAGTERMRWRTASGGISKKAAANDSMLLAA